MLPGRSHQRLEGVKGTVTPARFALSTAHISIPNLKNGPWTRRPDESDRSRTLVRCGMRNFSTFKGRGVELWHVTPAHRSRPRQSGLNGFAAARFPRALRGCPSSWCPPPVVLFLSRSSLLPSVSLLPVSPLLASSQYGRTALMFAAMNGHSEAIAALGKLGVNTDAVDKVRAPLGA